MFKLWIKTSFKYEDYYIGSRFHYKLIPTIIRNALKLNPIQIYGDDKNIYDWFYILDHCKEIDLVYHRGKSRKTYNIGSHNERDNNYRTQKIVRY